MSLVRFTVLDKEALVTVTVTLSQNDVEAPRQTYIYAETPNGRVARGGYVTQQAANGATITVTPSYKGNVAASGTSFTALVYCTESWRQMGSYDWIVCSPTTGNSGTTEVTVTVSPNDSAARLGAIYFYRGSTANNAGITISQNAAEGVSISVSPASVSGFTAEGGTINVDVISTNPWTGYIYSSNLTASPYSGSSGTTTVTMTVAANTDAAARTSKYRFFIGNVNAVYTEFEVTQEGASS